MDIETTLTSEKDFICYRCGQCCIVCPLGKWKGADLTKEQINVLLEERKKSPDYGLQCCEMLVWKDNEIKEGNAICLVHKLFGREKKEVSCRDYPKIGETCLNGRKRADR